MIDTLEKKVLSGVSVVQHQQLSIKSSQTYRLKLLLIPGIIVNLLF